MNEKFENKEWFESLDDLSYANCLRYCIVRLHFYKKSVQNLYSYDKWDIQ